MTDHDYLAELAKRKLDAMTPEAREAALAALQGNGDPWLDRCRRQLAVRPDGPQPVRWSPDGTADYPCSHRRSSSYDPYASF